MRKKSIFCLIVVVLFSSMVLPVLVTAGPPGRKLEKKVIIHYKKGYGKPPGTPGVGPDKPDKDDGGDYVLLGKGVKWKTTPGLVIDPDNGNGMSEEFIVTAITASAGTWDVASGLDLSGDYPVDYLCSWDDDATDGRNEVLFGDYGDPNVIAVTVIWGIFGGRPSQRQIVEFDILFNDYFDWGDVDESGSGVMDLVNIATHELGHGYGLGDLYDTSANQETMYGYSGYGETIKRDLYDGDIAGIQSLYGA